jgi:hypothetical protein
LWSSIGSLHRGGADPRKIFAEGPAISRKARNRAFLADDPLREPAQVSSRVKSTTTAIELAEIEEIRLVAVETQRQMPERAASLNCAPSTAR